MGTRWKVRRTSWKIVWRIGTDIGDANIVRYASVSQEGCIVSPGPELSQQVSLGRAQIEANEVGEQGRNRDDEFLRHNQLDALASFDNDFDSFAGSGCCDDSTVEEDVPWKSSNQQGFSLAGRRAAECQRLVKRLKSRKSPPEFPVT